MKKKFEKSLINKIEKKKIGKSLIIKIEKKKFGKSLIMRLRLKFHYVVKKSLRNETKRHK